MKEITFTLNENTSVSQYILNKGQFLKNEVDNSFLTELSSLLSSNKTNNKNSPNSDKSGSKFLTNFWNRLISTPESFSQHPNTEISKILEEEKVISASNITNTILSQKLNLDINSVALSKAVEQSTKIFHEDFPGDYILEYMGDRLGIFLWDVCYDCNGKAKFEYKFNPEIKTFRGIF